MIWGNLPRLVIRSSACILLIAPLAVRASADERFVGILALAAEDEVAQQLGLPEDTRAALDELVDDRIDKAEELLFLPQEQREQAVREFVAESEAEGFKLLTPEQQAKLQQIRIARAGLITLTEPEIAEQLELSPQQRAQIEALAAQRNLQLAQGGQRERQATRQRFEQQFADVLTRDQLLAWNQLAGQEAGAPVAQEQPEDQPQNGAAAEANPDPQDDVAEAPRGNDKLKFNWSQTPWEHVLEWYADQAGYSFQHDEGVMPQGTFTLQDDNEYTPAQALDRINAVLFTQGFTLVRSGRMLILINQAEDGIPSEIVETVTPDQLADRGDFELVKCLFTLKNLTAENAREEIVELVDEENGFLKVMPTSRHILVQETGQNLRMIQRVLEKAEAEASLSAKAVQVVTLKHVSPEEVITAARPHFGIAEDEFGTEDGSLVISLEPLSQRLLCSGSPDMVTRFMKFMDVIDVDVSEELAGNVPEELELVVHPVNADPQTVLEVVQVILAGLEGVRATVDAKTGNLIVLAKPTQQDLVRKIIKDMEQDAVDFDVIPLYRYDPAEFVAMLNEFMGSTAGTQDQPKKGPTISADLTSNTLIVRGTRAEIEMIQQVVSKLDPDPGSDPLGRSRVRLIPFEGGNPLSVVREAELLWPNAGLPNKIQVGELSQDADSSRLKGVIPSADPGEPIRFERLQDVIEPRKQSLPQEAAPRNGAAPRDTPKANDASLRRTDWQSVQLVALQPDAETAEQNADADSVPDNDSAAPEIEVEFTESGIVIRSDDLDALDQFESILRDAMNRRGTAPAAPTIYYLRYATAENAVAIVEQILGIGGGGGGGGNVLGDLASSFIGGTAGDVVGGLLGGDGGPVETSGDVRLTPEPRLNGVIVQAHAQDLELVRSILSEIDRSYAPQGWDRTYFIPILYLDANEVADVIRQSFPENLQSAASSQQREQQVAQQVIQQMLQRGGGRSRGGATQQDREKMTLTVHARSNSIIITGPEHLALRVKSLVEAIDRRDLLDQESIAIVPLRGNVKAELMSSSLTTLFGGSVSSSTTASAPSGPTGGQGSDGGRGDEDAIRRRLEFFRNIQQLQQQGGDRSSNQPGVPSGRGPGGDTGGPSGRRD